MKKFSGQSRPLEALGWNDLAMVQSKDFRQFESLVVDDQLSFRNALGDILADLGCKKIRLADCGLRALSEVCRCHPDVIFMDVLMPGMDGLTASTVIRDYETSQGRRAFILGLSNRSPTGYKNTVLRLAWTIALESQSMPRQWNNF